MLALTFIMMLVAMGIALADWRRGIIAMICVGVLQDPLRKVVEGIPAYFAVFSMAILGVVFVSAWLRNSLARTSLLSLGDSGLRMAWFFFFAVVLIQAFHGLVRWGNPLLPILGLVFYFGPVIALLLGLSVASTETRIRRFLISYVAIVTPAVLTVYLSPQYSDQWSVLREIGSFVGRELIIYDVGAALASHSGTFRVGEIAAWHAATVAIFIIIIASRDHSFALRVGMGILVILMIGAILLTGRRKMLMALSIFLILQFGIMSLFQRGSSRTLVTLLILGVFGSFAFLLLDPTSEQGLYLQRGLTVFEEAGERMVTALQLFISAVNRTDGLGFGAGVTAQGAQYAGGVVEAAGGASEAGAGKIVIELGLVGLIAVVLLTASLGVRIYQNLFVLRELDERLLYYSVSFIAFIGANAATFLVATQVFGDYFILSIVGLVGGMLFSLNLVAARVKSAHLERQLKRHYAATPTRSKAMHTHS